MQDISWGSRISFLFHAQVRATYLTKLENAQARKKKGKQALKGVWRSISPPSSGFIFLPARPRRFMGILLQAGKKTRDVS